MWRHLSSLSGKLYRARFQASSDHSDSANRPGYEAGYYSKTSQDYRSMIYRNRDFLALLLDLLLPLAGGPKDERRFDADWRLISSASFRTSSDNCKRNTQRHWCDWGDLEELSFVMQNVLQRRVSKLLNEPPYGRRLRVVPHFSSRIVKRAKRERAWKSPHAWGDFHARSRFARSIPEEKWGTTRSLYGRENQTNRRTCLEKLVQWNNNIIFD